MKKLNLIQMFLCSVVTVLALAVPGVNAVTLNLTPSEDSCADRWTPETTTYGSRADLWIAAAPSAGSTLANMFIKFDLSSIPAGATINSAQLKLTVWADKNFTSSGQIFKATKAWTELEMTFGKYDGTNAWTLAGGDAVDSTGAAITDWYTVNSNPYASVAIVDPRIGDIHTYDIKTLVQEWLATASNMGLVVHQTPDSWGDTDYWAREAGASGPVLTIDYTPAVTVPVVTLTAPNGGESWKAGSTHTITWSFGSIAPTQNINLNYSTDSGSTWKPIVAGLASSARSYVWTVPVDFSTTCMVQVSSATAEFLPDASNAVFAIDPAATAVLGAIADSFGDYYGKDTVNGSAGIVVMTTSPLPDRSNLYNIFMKFDLSSIPAGAVIQSAQLKLTNSADKATVASGQIFKATKPWTEVGMTWNTYDGTNAWTVGGGDYADTTGAWVTDPYATNANPYASLPINNPRLGDVHTYDITGLVLEEIATACNMGLVIHQTGNWADTNYYSKEAVSDQPVLTVYYVPAAGALPVVTLTSPNGGQEFIGGTTHTVTWSFGSTAPTSNINLKYSTDNGVSWMPIVTGLASTARSYSWTVPSVYSANYKVQVSSAAAEFVPDASDATFEIYECTSVIYDIAGNDCKVDLKDFAALASEWLQCGSPSGVCN